LAHAIAARARDRRLSGPAIKPLALARCAEAAAVRIPVIGSGGIASGRDALEFLAIGAAAVQVGPPPSCAARGRRDPGRDAACCASGHCAGDRLDRHSGRRERSARARPAGREATRDRATRRAVAPHGARS